MIVTFYVNNADNRKVDKTNDLTLIKTINDLTFKADTNKGAVTLELTFDSDLMSANYCYIQDFGYYYNMSEPILSKQRMFFDLNTDLLMTYKDDIKQLGCIISRQEKNYNTYLNDDRFPVLNKQDVNTLKFPIGFSSSEELLLMVNGG